MCYRCETCKRVVPQRVSCKFLVFKTRPKQYPMRQKANRGYMKDKAGNMLQPLKKSKKNSDRLDDPGGSGYEIIDERAVCQKCLDGHIES